MMSFDDYQTWWETEAHCIEDPVVLTLAMHVEALRDRIDKIGYDHSILCGCAYDHPLDRCMTHHTPKPEIKPLREFVGYDSAHEHCEECKECLFGEDSVVKLDDSWPGDFKHSNPERCEITKTATFHHLSRED